jgi:tRNA threonylcarbamoyl adenosine modification protein (Sua5/YciO/YrdC/YwlC family)
MNPKKPLTFICANQTEVQEYTQGIPTQVFKLLRRKLPGPYTFVFKAAKVVPKMMLTPRNTVGLRWPNHPITNEIVKTFGHPILSISLRISEDKLYDDPLELHEKYKKQVDLIVDGGTIFAENSTIIDFSHGEAEIVRMGKGPVDWLEEV